MKTSVRMTFLFLAATLVFGACRFAGAGDKKPLEGKFIAYVTPGAGQGGSSFMSMSIANVETACREMAEKYGFEFTVVTCTEASQ